MMTCTVCGQPMPQARANQLTCSAKCRTKRYRLAQPRPLTGSGRLRQGLMLARPARFYLIKPDVVYELENSVGVSAHQWDATLQVLNQIWFLLEPIDIILMWQEETGYTPPNDEPVEDLYLADLGDVGAVVLQALGDFRKRLAELQEMRSPASRVIARHQGVLQDALMVLVGQGRQFARRVHALTEPYAVDFSADFMGALTGLQAAVEACWFAVYDQVE